MNRGSFLLTVKNIPVRKVEFKILRYAILVLFLCYEGSAYGLKSGIAALY